MSAWIDPTREVLSGAEPVMPFNKNLMEVIRLTERMLELASEGDRSRNDPACGILYGILRDAAYRLRKLAETECLEHKRAGKWG